LNLPPAHSTPNFHFSLYEKYKTKAQRVLMGSTPAELPTASYIHPSTASKKEKSPEPYKKN